MFPYTESYILSEKEASYFLSKVLWIGLQIYKILHGLTRKKQNKKVTKSPNSPNSFYPNHISPTLQLYITWISFIPREERASFYPSKFR